MKKFTYLLLVLFTSSLLAQEESTVTPQIAVKINLGASVTIDGNTLEFVEVIEDSRCPKDVTCVWAGEAKVKVIISSDGGATEEVSLIVSKRGKNSIKGKDGITFNAVGLTPYPTTANSGKRDYTLLIIQEKE